MQDQNINQNVRKGADSYHRGDYIGKRYCTAARAALWRSARKSFYCSLAGLGIFLLSFVLMPYAAAESAAHAETARTATKWGTISLTLDPDVDATTEYNNTSGASGSQIGDAGHGDVEFGALNPTAKDVAAGSYGTLRVLKKTIGVSTTGKYYTVYLSMSKKDINNATNNNGLNLVTATSGGATTATDSDINLPAVAGTFTNPTAFSGPGWGFAVPNAKTTGNISTAGNFLTTYYTDSEINVSSTASGAADTYANSLWAAVPTADDPVQIWKQTTTSSTGFSNDTFDIYYAVAVDTNTLAGTYENNVVYTAVANTTEIDKVSSNLLRDLAYGGAGDTLTINFDLANSTAYIDEDDITITLVPHDVMVANDYDDEADIDLATIKGNSTNLDCPVVANSLDLLTGTASEVSAGKTTSIQCTIPTGTIEDGTGKGTYDILLTIAGYNYNYVSVYQHGSGNALVGAFVYAGLQSVYANMADGATNPDARYVADTPIVTKMQDMTAGICGNTYRFGKTGGTVTGLDGIGTTNTVLYKADGTTQVSTGATALTDGSFALTDTRDGKRYVIRRYADGECWMAQNLNLDLYSGMTLTADDTNITTPRGSWTIADTAQASTAADTSMSWISDAGSTSSAWQAAHGVETVTLTKYTYANDEWDGGTVLASCTGGTQQAPCYAATSGSIYYKLVNGVETAVTAAIALADGYYYTSNNTNTGSPVRGFSAGAYYGKVTYTVRKIQANSGSKWAYDNVGTSCTFSFYNDHLVEGNACVLTTTGETMVTQLGENIGMNGYGMGVTAITKDHNDNAISFMNNTTDLTAYQQESAANDTVVWPYATNAGDYRWHRQGRDGAHVHDFGPVYYNISRPADSTSSVSSYNGSTACTKIGKVSGTLTLNGNTLEFVSCMDDTDVTIAKADTTVDGNWYNWYAATAGSAISNFNDEDAADSICPKGWELPRNSGNKSFQNLMATTYGMPTGGGLTNGDSGVQAEPLAFLRSGFYGWGNGGLYNRGGGGNFWSSHTYSTYGSHYLYFGSTYLGPQGGGGKGNGFAVRCVAV